LIKEKELARLRDRLNAERRDWVRHYDKYPVDIVESAQQ
jgi:predicted dithiol-disulfide oxidoreductase (DUF899 family)